MKHVVINGVALEYRDYPAAAPGRPVLLLLHEGLGCLALWRDFPEKLAARTGCRTVAWSRAGYGSSEPYARRRTPRYMHIEAIEMLPAFLAAMAIERPLLVGHSDGASIALIHAGAFPGQALGVVAMAPHEFVEPETLTGIRAARETWLSTNMRQRMARYHCDPERVFAEWNETWLSPAFIDWNIEEYLPAIRCPVLAIQGEDDEYASMRQIEIIAEQVPGSELLKLPACGHSPQRDQSAAVLSAIAAFVERASGSCR